MGIGSNQTRLQEVELGRLTKMAGGFRVILRREVESDRPTKMARGLRRTDSRVGHIGQPINMADQSFAHP